MAFVERTMYDARTVELDDGSRHAVRRVRMVKVGEVNAVEVAVHDLSVGACRWIQVAGPRPRGRIVDWYEPVI